MEQISKVVKNEQDSSDEGYYNFKYQKTISYHKTPSGARIKVLDKIEEELKLLKERKQKNAHFSEDHWVKEEKRIKENTTTIAEGISSECEYTTCPLFEIITINLED